MNHQPSDKRMIKAMLFSISVLMIPYLVSSLSAVTYNYSNDWTAAGNGQQGFGGVWYSQWTLWDQNNPANFTDLVWDATNNRMIKADQPSHFTTATAFSAQPNLKLIVGWQAPKTGTVSFVGQGSNWVTQAVYQIIDKNGTVLTSSTVNPSSFGYVSVENVSVAAGDRLYFAYRPNSGSSYSWFEGWPIKIEANFTSDMEMTVTTPASVPHIHYDEVYPADILGMNVADGWWFGGATGGNSGGVTRVDAPGRPGQKALQFWFYANQSSPQWFAWSYDLNPQLSVFGAGELVFDVYAVDDLNCDVTARFGTQIGTSVLPICWDLIGHHTAGHWDEVRIPIRTQRDIDNIKFDLDNQSAGVPNLQTVRFIIDNIRFEPTPDPVAEYPIASMARALPVKAGYLAMPQGSMIKDNQALSLHLEMSVTSQQNATIKVTMTPAGQSSVVWAGALTLINPYTVVDLTIGNIFNSCGDGDIPIQVEILDQYQNSLAWLSPTMTIGVYSSTSMEQQRQTLISIKDSLQSRVNSLKVRNIGVDAPQVSLTVADLFLDTYIPDDFNRQEEYEIAMQELMEISSLLDKASAEISLLETSQNPPGPVVTYDPTKAVYIQQGAFVQNSRPIAFIGPLAWDHAQDFISYAKGLGFNSVVVETGLSQWYNGQTSGSSQVSAYLSAARGAGIAANLLLSSHMTPTLTTADAPAISDDASGSNFPWNILKTESRTVFTNWYSSVANVAKAYPIVSFGTANEPDYSVGSSSVSFRDAFRLWAYAEYSQIATANARWGSSYSSFDSIDLPSFFTFRQTSKAASYDWARFVAKNVGQFYAYMATRLSSLISGKAIWIKLMGEPGYNALDEQEILKAYGQNVHGTDGNSLLWLDYTKSLNLNLPIVNSEWHIIFNTLQGNDVSYLDRMIFEGVVHGIGMGQIWQWCRYDWGDSTHGSVSSMPRYPLGLDSLGRASVKVRDLIPALTRFANLTGGPLRVLYSKVSHLHQSSAYIDNVNNVYNRLSSNTSGVRFVVPETLTSSILNSSVKLLAAGNAQYIQTSALSVIEQWVNAGGTLWLTEPGLNRDPWDVVHSGIPSGFLNLLSTTGDYTYGSGRVIVNDAWTGYLSLLDGPFPMTSGEVNTNVECRRASDGVNLYFYLINRSDTWQSVTLSSKPIGFAAGRDLWSNQQIDLAGAVALPANGVVLMKGGTFTPGDANGDGMVDVGDLGILAANYGGTNKTWAQGDFNRDGAVDVGDLGILAAHYGEGVNATLDFAADYARAFSETVTDDTTNDAETSSSVCNILGLPLIAGLTLMGLMLVKLEEEDVC